MTFTGLLAKTARLPATIAGPPAAIARRLAMVVRGYPDRPFLPRTLPRIHGRLQA